jgi:pimeloyl-ACP methyl ester carboxylesterase
VNPAAAGAFARLGELELYYETQGTGPPLVLIHGSLMTADLLNDYPARLARARGGRQSITVELQGHGHTRDIGRPLRYELLADDIATLLDHLGLARADLAGYSLGPPWRCRSRCGIPAGSGAWPPCPSRTAATACTPR